MARPRRSGWACVALAAMAAALPRPAWAIVGPSSDGAALEAYVVMVLQRSGPVAGFCSGIVLAPEAVLTAAHCVPTGADLRIHFRDAAGAPVLLPIAAIERHPGYRADAIKARRRSIDLALLRLQDPLPERFRPAPLGNLRSTVVGSGFRVAGYGVTREAEGSSSGRLRVTVLGASAPLSSVLLWAKGGEAGAAGACTGDSGGPVLDAQSNRVEAITIWSAGVGSSRCGDLTQALWIAPHRDWIAGVLAGWGITP